MAPLSWVSFQHIFGLLLPMLLLEGIRHSLDGVDEVGGLKRSRVAMMTEKFLQVVEGEYYCCFRLACHRL